MTDAQAPKGHTPLPWAWFVEDYSMLNLGNADDHLTGHVVSISPCNSCLKRAAEEPHPQWEWGRCTTISEANAALIVERVNKGPAADAMAEAAKALVEFHEGPTEAKRPDVFALLMGNLAQALTAYRGEA